MNEVCPCCGEFVRSLYELTGWCASCSTKHGRTCTRCGERRDLHDFYKMRGGRRSICKTCDIQARQARRDATPQPSLRTPIGKIGPGRVNGPAPVGHLVPGGNP